MAFFTNAQGVEVVGGQFTAMTTAVTNNNNTNTYMSGLAGIDILREASAPEAAHDSSARTYSPRCFPGTRKQYIEDIIQRAIPSLGDIPLPIYWMNGPAGVGKSAVAQTCAEELQKKGLLGAAFFFSISGQRSPEKLFPSIAYQLSTMHSSYRELLDRRIRRDKTLVDKAMRFQFRYLIDEPLRELEENGRGIRKGVQIFVDGLDECDGVEAQCEIIRIIAAAAHEGVLPLCWSFFSRPESHIWGTFSETSANPHCYKTTLPISKEADGEIELYLKNCIDNVLSRHNTPTRNSWPSTEEMNTIVHGSHRSFIYATTVARFIGRPHSLGPEKRLRAIIDTTLDYHSRASTSPSPFPELDALYTLILQYVPLKIFPSVHLLLALMCRLGSSGGTQAANLLNLSRGEFENVCSHVGAVLRFENPGKHLELDSTINTELSYLEIIEHVPQRLYSQVRDHLGGRITFYHKSFYDFLLDPARSGNYCVRGSESLAKHLVKIHLDYGRRFRWRNLNLALVPDSATFLSYPYTNELINSILITWVFVRAGGEDPDCFPIFQEAGGLSANCNFRKHLYVNTNILVTNGAFSWLLWGYQCQRKHFPEVLLDYIDFSNNKLDAKFNVVGFKLMIEQQKRENVIQRHHPGIISRIKSLFHKKSQEGVECALYRMGRGKKSIFWYWEINYKLQYYRSFSAIDLAEGRKIFQGEDFDLWARYGHDRSPDR